MRSQLDRGEAGMLGHPEVSSFYIYASLIDLVTNLEIGFDGSLFGSATGAASDTSASSSPYWFSGASGDRSGGWRHGWTMRHRQ